MSIETLLFLMLLTQIALIVLILRVERRTLEVIHRAQSQNAKWLIDTATSLRRQMRELASQPGERSDAVRDPFGDYRNRERQRSWESRSED